MAMTREQQQALSGGTNSSFEEKLKELAEIKLKIAAEEARVKAELAEAKAAEAASQKPTVEQQRALSGTGLTGNRDADGSLKTEPVIPTMEDLNTWYHIMVKQAGEDWMKNPAYKESADWYNEQKKLTGQETESGWDNIPIAEWDENQEFDADGNPVPRTAEQVVTYDDEIITEKQISSPEDDLDKDERTDAESEKQKFMGIDREQGRTMAMEDDLPERSMGFQADDGGNMSVDEKDDFWKTQEGYDKAVEMYGSKPAWVKEPTLIWNPETQEYEEVEPEEFEDLSRPSISADIKKLFG